MMMKAGDTVKYAVEIDPSDAVLRFTVLWVNSPRAQIKLICTLPIAPTFIVNVADIVLA